jgi:hypothetical protein
MSSNRCIASPCNRPAVIGNNVCFEHIATINNNNTRSSVSANYSSQTVNLKPNNPALKAQFHTLNAKSFSSLTQQNAAVNSTNNVNPPNQSPSGYVVVPGANRPRGPPPRRSDSVNGVNNQRSLYSGIEEEDVPLAPLPPPIRYDNNEGNQRLSFSTNYSQLNRAHSISANQSDSDQVIPKRTSSTYSSESYSPAISFNRAPSNSSNTPILSTMIPPPLPPPTSLPSSAMNLHPAARISVENSYPLPPQRLGNPSQPPPPPKFINTNNRSLTDIQQPNSASSPASPSSQKFFPNNPGSFSPPPPPPSFPPPPSSAKRIPPPIMAHQLGYSSEKFISESLLLVDNLLEKLRDFDVQTVNPHRWAELLYESAMTCRETLNCWNEDTLHAAAVNSLDSRVGAMRSIINNELEASPLLIDDNKTSVKEKVTKRMTIKHHLLTVYRSDTSYSCYDLRNLVSIEEIRTGKESDFHVCFNDKQAALSAAEEEATSPTSQQESKSSAPNPFTIVQFRAVNDTERQRWVGILNYFLQTNKISLYLQQSSIADRIQLRVAAVYKHRKQFSDRKFDFLFALDPTSCGSTEALAPANSLSNSFCVRERFPVVLVKSLSKDKPRMLEIDLTRPARFSILKQATVQSCLVQNTYLREDVMDFRVQPGKKSLEIVFKSGDSKVRYEFIFPHVTILGRFWDIFTAFQLIPAELRAEFVHFGIVHTLHNAKNEPTVRLFDVAKNSAANCKEFDDCSLYRGELRNFFGQIVSHTINNTHAVQLAEASKQLPLDDSGDLIRLKMLASKLFAVDNFNHPASIGELEEFTPCLCKAPTNFNPNTVNVSATEEITQNLSPNCLFLFYRSFILCDGLVLLQRFLRSSNEEINGWALRCIYQTFQLKNVLHKCDGALAYHDQYLLTYKFSLFYYIQLVMNEKGVTEALVALLFELLISAHKAPRFIDASVALPSEKLQALNKPITEPALLPILFFALSHCNSAQVCTEGLQNFILLLNSSGNSEAFLSSLGWQNWLLPLLFEPYSNPLNKAPRDKNSESYKLTMALFSTLHYEKMCRDRESKEKNSIFYHIVSNSLDILDRFNGWNDESIQITRSILLATLNKLKARAREFTNNFSFSEPSAWDPIFNLNGVIEDYIFFRPLNYASNNETNERTLGKAEIHLSADAEPVDLQIVEALLDVLSTLQLGRAAVDSVEIKKDERAVRNRGLKDFEFYSNVKDCFSHLNHNTTKLQSILKEAQSRANNRAS